MMNLLLVVVCGLFSYGIAAPIAEKDVEKRRESTPEILGLEKQLKKAAGENKQYFSSPNSRPMPQIDGLDHNNEQLQDSVDKQPELPISDPPQDDVMEDPEDVPVDDQQESYLAMWQMFKQHPEYMEELYQDYLTNPEGRVMDMNQIAPDEASDENKEYENVKRASEVGVFAYPSENDLSAGGAYQGKGYGTYQVKPYDDSPNQGNIYMPSDAQDRTAALMADYAAAADDTGYPLPGQQGVGGEYQDEPQHGEEQELQSLDDEQNLEEAASVKGDENSEMVPASSDDQAKDSSSDIHHAALPPVM